MSDLKLTAGGRDFYWRTSLTGPAAQPAIPFPIDNAVRPNFSGITSLGDPGVAPISPSDITVATLLTNPNRLQLTFNDRGTSRTVTNPPGWTIQVPQPFRVTTTDTNPQSAEPWLYGSSAMGAEIWVGDLTAVALV